MKTIMLVILLCLTSCTPLAGIEKRHTAMVSWVGMPVEILLDRCGDPTTVRSADNGAVCYNYMRSLEGFPPFAYSKYPNGRLPTTWKERVTWYRFYIKDGIVLSFDIYEEDRAPDNSGFEATR